MVAHEELEAVTSIVQPPDVFGGGYTDQSDAGLERSSTASLDGGDSQTPAAVAPSPTVIYVTATIDGGRVSTSETVGTIAQGRTSTDEFPQTPRSTIGGIGSISTTQDFTAVRTVAVSFSSPSTSTLSQSLQADPSVLPTVTSDVGLPAHSNKLIAPIAGTIIPVTLVAVFLGSFCVWYRKKKIRDRQLDDLERTAIWVNRVSDTSSILTEQIVTQGKRRGSAQGTQPESMIEGEGESHSTAEESNLTIDAIRTCRSSPDDCSTEHRNPFATPTDEDNDSPRTSQIGLAITTSIHSRKISTSSTGTTIRHVVPTDQGLNPFASDADSPPPSETAQDPSMTHHLMIDQNSPEDHHVLVDDSGEDPLMEYEEEGDQSAPERSSVETIIYSPVKAAKTTS